MLYVVDKKAGVATVGKIKTVLSLSLPLVALRKSISSSSVPVQELKLHSQ